MKLPEFDRYAIDIHSHFNHGVPGDHINSGIDMLNLSTLIFLYVWVIHHIFRSFKIFLNFNKKIRKTS